MSESSRDLTLLHLPPKIGVTPAELWDEISRSLDAICRDLQQRGAAIYVAPHNDYTEFRRVATTDAHHTPDGLALPTYAAFAWILEQGRITLPTTKGEMSWLDPRLILNAPHAILFGHETIGGNLVLAMFLSDTRATGSTARRLDRFTTNRLFPYIATAMFGIELDTLTTEIGHLMGRATGKIHSGLIALRAQLADCKPDDASLVTMGFQAADEGLRRLDLIKHNFYQFGLQRRATGRGNAIADDTGNTEFDVIPVLREMLTAFQADTIATRLQPPVIELRAAKAIVRGPMELLRIAFLNLYDNAMKFAYAHTHVRITAAVVGDRCAISFENLGIGVAPDEFKTVFQRLRRSRFKDPHRRIEGLGLGLAYCRRVVEELFHGHITLTSREVETRTPRRFEGDNWLTTVTVELPLASPPQPK